MADGLLTQGLNYIDQQKQALAVRLGLLMNNPQEFAAQLGSEARQRAGVGLLGEPKTAQDMASGAWINSPYGQQAMEAGSGFAGSIKPIEFSKRLLNTKVIDDLGNLKMVYHGTQLAPEGIKKFNPTVTMETGYQRTTKKPSGVTWFSDSVGDANHYASAVGGSKGLIVGNPTVYPSYLNIKNPATPDTKIAGLPHGFDPEIDLYNPDVIKKIKAAGFDGVVFSYIDDPVKNYVAFNSKQIISPFSKNVKK
jgi:hypothetical protein